MRWTTKVPNIDIDANWEGGRESKIIIDLRGEKNTQLYFRLLFIL